MGTHQAARVRPAMPGDEGVVIGWSNTSHSGLARSGIRVSRSEFVYVVGDWRAIRNIAEDLHGDRVQVVEGEGYDYWIRPLRAAA